MKKILCSARARTQGFTHTCSASALPLNNIPAPLEEAQAGLELMYTFKPTIRS